MQLRETRAIEGSAGSPTLLHFIVRQLLKIDPGLVHFLEEGSQIGAASRGECAIVGDEIEY
jgi:hypothetical protein